MRIVVQTSILLMTTMMLGCGGPDMPDTPVSQQGEADQVAKESAEKGEGESFSENGSSFDHLIEPPPQYYDELINESVKSVGLTGFGLAVDDTQVLYLNFDGAEIRKGYSRGQSFIPCGRIAKIPASGYSPGEQGKIADMVQNYYDESGSRVEVVTSQPAGGDFTTIVVGGTYRDLGCLRGNGILGVAPLDKGNNNKNDIGFSFTSSRHSIFTAATTIAHEAGHSFGLDHIASTVAIMNPSIVKGITGFGEGRLARGFGRQNSPKVLQANLGLYDPSMPRPVPTPPSQQNPPQQPNNPPSNNPPSNLPPVNNPPKAPGPIAGLPNLDKILGNLPGLEILGSLGELLNGSGSGQLPLDIDKLLPNIDKIIPGGMGNTPNLGGLPGLEELLKTLMASAAAGTKTGAVQPGQTISIDDLLNKVLRDGNLRNQGVQDFGSLIQLLGSGSQPAFAAAAPSAENNAVGGGLLGGLIGGIFKGIFGGGSNQPAGPSGPAPSEPAPIQAPNIVGDLPDFSALLGLSQFQTPEDLAWGIRGHSQVIEENFSGQQKDSLNTLVKLAYLQRYQAIK